LRRLWALARNAGIKFADRAGGSPGAEARAGKGPCAGVRIWRWRYLPVEELWAALVKTPASQQSGGDANG